MCLCVYEIVDCRDLEIFGVLAIFLGKDGTPSEWVRGDRDIQYGGL